jgi:hypothetical protein
MKKAGLGRKVDWESLIKEYWGKESVITCLVHVLLENDLLLEVVYFIVIVLSFV